MSGPPAAPKYDNYSVDLFYATNREKGASENPNYHYQNKMGNVTNLGVARVSVPDIHKKGELESAGIFSLWQENPAKHIMLRSLDEMTEQDFFRRLSNDVVSKDEKSLLIFVHGFNVTFSQAAKRFAQICYDIFSNTKKGSTIKQLSFCNLAS